MSEVIRAGGIKTNTDTFALPAPDTAAAEAARQRQAELTKPPGSLGRLESLACQMAAWQATAPPEARPATALLFAADHPLTRHGVCPYPSAVTRAMMDNFAAGGAAASLLAKSLDIALTVVDVGIATGLTCPTRTVHATLERADVSSCPAGDIRVEDAMSHETFAMAVSAGREAVRRCARGLRCLLLGEMGIGNSTAAAAVCAAILAGDPAEFVGAGTGSRGALLDRKRAVVRDAVARLRRRSTSPCPPREALRRVGGREIAALYGAMLEALSQRVVVVVDGYIVTAAALALLEEYPAARTGLVFAHRSDEQAHGRVLKHLGADPLLDLGMRLGEGSGALMAFPLIEQACRLHRHMATFASASIPRSTAGAE